MDYEVRPVRVDEWAAVKELRLEALRDPVASIAFLETYEEALARPDSFWQDRAAGASHGTSARQFVAQAPDGRLVGTVVMLVEEAGSVDYFGDPVERRQGSVVGVYVSPEARGSGLIRALFDAATEWVWSLEGLDRVRLYVHQDNGSAEAAYRRIGFARSGGVARLAGDPSVDEYEMEIKRP
ncbi:GNAT family N-acetyltransferase [Streptomyces sp. VRA16 Mangrove soil]|uniref:GNAT family N-acetyltransferase n=1 Tax=Streptomyces sp. VRA16 Mangrove soil TaxID=2817434 RepID=UPI001A9D5FB5|nr:GNAT family N-acetyltransferase [Streptomyces sp. VRA16 Mangrove soil]MBO1338049.1 GNAT family N-acetyltransferase [Streptomyces sp. VRA16 Mangrove soil]